MKEEDEDLVYKQATTTKNMHGLPPGMTGEQDEAIGSHNRRRMA